MNTKISQTGFFTNSVQRIISIDDVKRYGIDPNKLQNSLNTFCKIKAVWVPLTDLLSLNWRRLILEYMSNKKVVLLNYSRPLAHQEGISHWSPIASYNKKKDEFLVLDVAEHKYPLTWMPAEHLWQAAKGRGFMIISINL